MNGSHLILGGCGFLGRHLAVVLARAGQRVTLADRVQPDFAFPADVAERIVWRDFEFGSADWDALVADDPIVYHCAWGSLPATANSNPAGDLVINVHGTLGLLEAQPAEAAGERSSPRPAARCTASCSRFRCRKPILCIPSRPMAPAK